MASVDNGKNESQVNSFFKSGEDIGMYMIAASRTASKSFSVKFSSLGQQEFNQLRDPEDYAIEGRNGFFKLAKDPFNRSKKLVMYGYDTFDAYMFDGVGILCLSMIMSNINEPSGNVLWKIGKTRCSRPRYDAFLYNIHDQKYVLTLFINIFTNTLYLECTERKTSNYS